MLKATKNGPFEQLQEHMEQVLHRTRFLLHLHGSRVSWQQTLEDGDYSTSSPGEKEELVNTNMYSGTPRLYLVFYSAPSIDPITQLHIMTDDVHLLPLVELHVNKDAAFTCSVVMF